jgi:hypothetical protein
MSRFAISTTYDADRDVVLIELPTSGLMSRVVRRPRQSGGDDRQVPPRDLGLFETAGAIEQLMANRRPALAAGKAVQLTFR